MPSIRDSQMNEHNSCTQEIWRRQKHKNIQWYYRYIFLSTPNFQVEKRTPSWAWWHTTIIPATQKAQTGGSSVQGQPRQS
jgi:hypothetical protein